MAVSAQYSEILEDGIQFAEYVIEIGDQNDSKTIVSSCDVDDANSIILIQTLEGTPKIGIDPGSEGIKEVESDSSDNEQFRMLRGTVRKGRQIYISVSANAKARVKVLIGHIRSGFNSGFKRVRCNMCKKALSILMTAILGIAGIAPLPNGDFDLSSLQSNLVNFLTDMANGNYGSFLQSLVSILPQNLISVLLMAFAAFNWLLDATSAIYEWACQKLGFCVAPIPAASP